MMMTWGFMSSGVGVDILGTNCKKLLKVKMSGAREGGGEGGGGRFSFSTCNHVRGAARHLLLDFKKKTFCRWGCILLRMDCISHD